MRFNIWKDCPKVPITELLSFIVDNRGKTVPTADDGWKLIATNCVTNNTLFPVYEKVRYLTQETYETWFRAHPMPGDILFVNKGTPGRVCLVPDPVDFCIAQDMIALRADDEKIYNKYLFAVLRSREIQQQIYNTNVGDVIPHFKKQFMDQLLIPVPDRRIQEIIGNLYYELSYKTELNKKINKNLEQQAKAVFKSWFEDFDPFDEPLIETLAGIYAPASLQMVQIANIPHVLETGKRPKGGAVASGVPSIGAENVKQLGVVNFSSAKFIPEEFAAKMKTGAINGYELLLYKDGGKPGTFIPHFSMFGEGFPYQKFFINEHVFKLDFGDKGFNEFAYFFMQTDYAYHWLASNGGKAAVPGINQQNVKDIWIFSPENSKVKEFGEWVQPLFTTILKNCAQNVKLAELRDTLLSKLMSGELDVSDLDL